MDEVTALLKDGDDYVTKPFHPSLLLAYISAILKRRKRRQNGQLPPLLSSRYKMAGMGELILFRK